MSVHPSSVRPGWPLLSRSVFALGCVWLLGAWGPCEDLCPMMDEYPGGPDHDPYVAPSILALGDSVLAYHGHLCQSAPQHAGVEVERFVENRAITGSRMSSVEGSPFDIPNRYVEGGAWEYVIIDGGANDMYAECGCGVPDGDPIPDCSAHIDQIVDPAGQSGEMIAMIENIRSDPANDATMVLMGYYTLPDDAGSDWDGCNDALAELSARYALLAADADDVEFVDPTAIMDIEVNPDFFMGDRVHPSTYGADAMGDLFAPLFAAP